MRIVSFHQPPSIIITIIIITKMNLIPGPALGRMHAPKFPLPHQKRHHLHAHQIQTFKNLVNIIEAKSRPTFNQLTLARSLGYLTYISTSWDSEVQMQYHLILRSPGGSEASENLNPN